MLSDAIDLKREKGLLVKKNHLRKLPWEPLRIKYIKNNSNGTCGFVPIGKQLGIATGSGRQWRDISGWPRSHFARVWESIWRFPVDTWSADVHTWSPPHQGTQEYRSQKRCWVDVGQGVGRYQKQHPTLLMIFVSGTLPCYLGNNILIDQYI